MKSIYVGPESDKPSFSWVSKDIFDTLKDEYNVIYFRAFKEIPKSFDGLVFIIKEMPPLSFFVNNWKSRKIYIPVDFFKSEKHINDASLLLKLFDRIAVHNDLLKRFIDSENVSNVDHYVKYLVERKEPQNRYMWLGVVDYIPDLLRNLSKYPVLSQIPHVFLTDLDHLKKSLHSVVAEGEVGHNVYDVDVTEDKVFIGNYCFEQWSESSQRAAFERSAFAVDFKSDRFYHSTKPPTKVQVYLANDVPVFVNDEHYAVEYIRQFGFDCYTMSDFVFPLTNEMLTSQFTKARQMWSLESIAQQYVNLANQTLSQTRKSYFGYGSIVFSLMVKKLVKLIQSSWNKSQ